MADVINQAKLAEQAFLMQDVKPIDSLKQVQSVGALSTIAGSDAASDDIYIDGRLVQVHEDLKERYSDEETLRKMMRLRLAPMGTFQDCGDLHSLDGWGTKGEEPTIRMQLERGAITLEDTLKKAEKPQVTYGYPPAEDKQCIEPAVSVQKTQVAMQQKKQIPNAPPAQSSKGDAAPQTWFSLGVEYYIAKDGSLGAPVPIQAH